MNTSIFAGLALATTVATAVGASSVNADELTDASLALCEKVKACVLAEMGDQVTPQIRAMIQPTLDQMCDSVRSQVTSVPADHEMYQPAVTCINSLNQLSCATMTSGEDFITPQCSQYEEAGKKAAGLN